MEKFSAFALSLENINKCINKIKSIKISEYGIKLAHFNCMMHIDLTDDGLTTTELSQDCGVDKAFVSRTTADLIKSGLIQKNKKFDDGRKYKIKYILTEKGRQIIKETKDLIEKNLEEICGKISEYDMKSFVRVILSMSENMSNKSKAFA